MLESNGHTNYQFPLCAGTNMVNLRENLNNTTESIIQSWTDLWKHCEAEIVRLLRFCLSKSKEEEVDPCYRVDNYPVWLYDLGGLHDILQMSNQIICLSQEFLGPILTEVGFVAPLCSSTSHHELKDVLCDMFCQYLHEDLVHRTNNGISSMTQTALELSQFTSENIITNTAKSIRDMAKPRIDIITNASKQLEHVCC